MIQIKFTHFIVLYYSNIFDLADRSLYKLALYDKAAVERRIQSAGRFISLQKKKFRLPAFAAGRNKIELLK